MKLHGLTTRLACMAALLLACGHATALYKVVGPDGRITFTDRPTPETASGRVTTVTTRGAAPGDAASGALPYELRVATQKFPVTLYTTDKCEPCAMGRDLLSKRGVPFSERVSSSAEDKEAMEKHLGSSALPALKVGAQVLSGFQPSTWHSTLDVAGYPASSKLPSNHKAAAVTTVTPRQPKKDASQVERDAQEKLAQERADRAASERLQNATPAGSGGVRF